MTNAVSSRPSPGARPGRLLKSIAYMAALLAGAVVGATLILIAFDGHPVGLLTVPAGATVPVILWSVWKLRCWLDPILTRRHLLHLVREVSVSGITRTDLTGEIVTIYRKLTAADPGRYRPALAEYLTLHGTRLSVLGRGEEALTAEQEAVTIYRDLAAAVPAATARPSPHP